MNNATRLSEAMRNVEIQEGTLTFGKEPPEDIALYDISNTISKLNAKLSVLETEHQEAQDAVAAWQNTATTRWKQMDAIKTQIDILKNALRSIEDNPCP